MTSGVSNYPFKTMWRGLITHGLAILFLVGGLFLNMSGVMNLFTFISFIYAGLMIVLLFTSSDGLEPHIPPWISMVFYITMTCIVVYFEHYWLGLAWLVSGLILGHLTDEYLKKMKEVAEKAAKKIAAQNSSGDVEDMPAESEEESSAAEANIIPKVSTGP